MAYPRTAVVYGTWGLDPDMIWRLYLNSTVAFMNNAGIPNYRELLTYSDYAPGANGYGEPTKEVGVRVDAFSLPHHASNSKPSFTLHNLGYIEDDDIPVMVLTLIHTSLINHELAGMICVNDVDSFNPFTMAVVSKLKNLKID